MTSFRAELLAGRTVVLAGRSDAVRDGLLALGARVEILADVDAATPEERVGDWARTRSPLHAVIFDASTAFGAGGQAGLRAASARAWAAIREVAAGALIPQQEGGKVVLIANAPGPATFAPAARSALENLARTLSIEWARHRITATLIAPGAATTDAQVAQLACFLISPAGDYFSGCRFSLDAASSR
jgi:NAD(P)-dependent dehydrogenase (short-subunit alcohol dehydrogenase family)